MLEINCTEISTATTTCSVPDYSYSLIPQWLTCCFVIILVMLKIFDYKNSWN